MYNTSFNQTDLNMMYYQNLLNALRVKGFTDDQIVQMSLNPYGGSNNMVQGGVQGTPYQTHPAQQQVKQEVVHQNHTKNYDQDLLLDMFSIFCKEQPANAKELSVAFTKFSRWMQSTVDKQNAQGVPQP